MLTDNHGRKINYLRLAVTDRCNLRCFYCMPEEGLQWLSREDLMTYEEMLRICSLLVHMGIEKIRITGGEPFVRKDMMKFLTSLSKLNRLKELTITTNGVLTAPLVPELKKLGIKTVNLSLDTLDANRFFAITCRDEFAKVMDTLDALLKHGIQVKINAVVMEGKNTQDIIPMAGLTKDLPVSVRFIEEMPFNGEGHVYKGLQWDYMRIMEHIREQFPSLQKLDDPAYSTSNNYHIPGHKGDIGVIAAYSRTFCGTCNRIRITPQGVLKTCLYDEGVLNIRDQMRSGSRDDEIRTSLLQALGNRPKDGREAEQLRNINDPAHESMATIGG
ncbi:MAG TPA: GTP 3',8-cyclase MoaA [Mucilaginibacter sp.]|nr:GTP 3',8-cyclase MoaA [Mucilaginibacter sp.]